MTTSTRDRNDDAGSGWRPGDPDRRRGPRDRRATANETWKPGDPDRRQSRAWRPGDPDRRQGARSLLVATGTTKDDHMPISAAVRAETDRRLRTDERGRAQSAEAPTSTAVLCALFLEALQRREDGAYRPSEEFLAELRRVCVELHRPSTEGASR